MVYMKPWNKESQRILDQLTMDLRASTMNTRLSVDFGKKYPELIELDFLDMATTKYRKKKNKTIYSLPKNVRVIPRKGKYFFHKIL